MLKLIKWIPSRRKSTFVSSQKVAEAAGAEVKVAVVLVRNDAAVVEKVGDVMTGDQVRVPVPVQVLKDVPVSRPENHAPKRGRRSLLALNIVRRNAPLRVARRKDRKEMRQQLRPKNDVLRIQGGDALSQRRSRNPKTGPGF